MRWVFGLFRITLSSLELVESLQTMHVFKNDIFFILLSPSHSRLIFRFVLIQNIISGEFIHSFFLASSSLFSTYKRVLTNNMLIAYAIILSRNVCNVCWTLSMQFIEKHSKAMLWGMGSESTETYSTPVDAVSLWRATSISAVMRAWVQFVYAQEPKMHAHTLERIFNTHYFVMPTIWLLFYCYHKFSSNWNVWKRKTRSNKSECFWLKHFVECWVDWMYMWIYIQFYKWNLRKKNLQTK